MPTSSTIPPYAGVCTPEEVTRPGFSVAEASARLRRIAYAKRRLTEIAAAHLSATPEWEVKPALALHAWLDAQHINALRARVLELREPESRLNEVPDPDLAAALDEALWSEGTTELLAAIYGVFRKAVLEAIERYLEQTNPLADFPGCRVLKVIASEELEMIAWGEQALTAVTSSDESRGRASTWSEHLQAFLAAAGGVDGTNQTTPPWRSKSASDKSGATADPPRRGRLGLRSRGRLGLHKPDIMPRRDARFHGLFDDTTPADTIYLDETRSSDERNLALLFKRIREMDVPEAIAGILAQTPGKAWDYYADMLRQMWDEARHALLGQAELEARGVDWTRLPVNLTFSWKLAKFCTPLERHIVLYGIEQSLMAAGHGKRKEWEIAQDARDALSTTFQDFDWADEVLHAAIGRRHLREHVRDGADALRQADELGARIGQALEREGMPDDRPAPDWWEKFASSLLRRPVPPAPVSALKDWRPTSA